MPELSTAAADSAVAGTEKLLTLAFEYLTVAQVRDFIHSATINAQTGTTYTTVLTDMVVTMDNVSANTLTIPPNSSVAYPVGWSLEVWQKGAGQTTIAEGSGVTILYDSADTLKLKGQEAGCSLRKVDTDTWRLIGKMEAA